MWILGTVPLVVLLASAPRPPTIEKQFAHLAGWTPRISHGAVRVARDDDAADGWVADLVFPGDPALGPDDRVGPVRWPVELASAEPFGFGSYRARLELASCGESEELVSAFFAYANDGTDHDGNGIVDNAEIDFEVLCGEPHLLWMTVWTDYQRQNGQVRCRKQTRVVDMRDGSARDSPPGSACASKLEASGRLPGVSMPDFPGRRFHELGFDWYADRVSFFIVIEGRETTLWELTDPRHIPRRPARVRLQLWHPRSHWHSGGDADYPARDGTLRVDWVRHWAAR